MTKQICKSELCSGCSACANSCPSGCISMKPDPEGFIRPVIDSAVCVDCGLCVKTCPVNNITEDDKKEPITYACKCKNDGILKNSSSGGIFTLLGQEIISRGGVVFGAGYDSEFNVVHKIAATFEELEELRGSKYVQSSIGDTYKTAKNYLEKGADVLFTGTPCQISGLYAYLKKDYNYLYTQDIICHGVPSPAVWKIYLKHREDLAGSKAEKISFRDKSNGWKQYSLMMQFKNGEYYCERNINDPYLRSFIMNMDLRVSCEHCSFKKIHREADITLADFWGVDKVIPDWNDDTGISSVMIHSQKGGELFERIKDKTVYTDVEFNECLKSNPSMTSSVPCNLLRKRFMKDAQKMPFDKLHDKYCGNGFISKLRRKAALVLRKIKEVL